MFPHNDGLITALIKLRQAEIQREFERYRRVQAARAPRAIERSHLATVLQRVWRRVIGTESPFLERSARADSKEERWSG